MCVIVFCSVVDLWVSFVIVVFIIGCRVVVVMWVFFDVLFFNDWFIEDVSWL